MSVCCIVFISSPWFDEPTQLFVTLPHEALLFKCFGTVDRHQNTQCCVAADQAACVSHILKNSCKSQSLATHSSSNDFINIWTSGGFGTIDSFVNVTHNRDHWVIYRGWMFIHDICSNTVLNLRYMCYMYLLALQIHYS